MANPTIEKKLVEMDFDNSRFEKNVNQSIGTLDRLKQALNLDGAAKSFNAVEKQANSIDFSGLEKSIARIEYRFSALGVAGATVISNLTNKAIGAVSKMNNAIFGQMKSGGIARALNLEHANFMLEGLLKDAGKVAEIMKEGGPVQNAVKGTAYGLDAAANAAAQFVASGLTDTTKLENALTAISGAAAMTGSSYEDISRIFTTVAGNGRLMGDQLLQFSARGLNVASALAESLHKTEAEIRDMVSKGKIDFETFAEVMNDAFGEQAKKANETFTGAMSNVKAALSRIGAKVATPTIENLRVIFVRLIKVIDTASKTLQPFIDFINNVIYTISKGIVIILEDVDNLNAVFTNIIGTIGEVFRDIYSVILPIKRAFQDVFPQRTIDDAITLTGKIRELAASLRLSAEGMVTVRRIFRGVFGIFDILAQTISALVRVLFPATNGLKGLIGSFANGAATISDYIYALSKVLRETDLIYKLFSKLTSLKIPFVGDIFTNLVNAFKKNESPLQTAGNVFNVIFGGIKNTIEELSPLLGAFAQMVGNALGEIGNAFEEVFSGGGFKTLLALVNSAILSKIAIDIATFIKRIGKNVEAGTSIFKKIGGMFSSISGFFNTLKMGVKVDVVKNMAIAIGILVGSLTLLSLIKPEALAASIAAITILMGELMGMLYLFTKIVDSLENNLSIMSGAVSFAAIGAGVLLLAGAMKSIASIDSSALRSALDVMTALLAELTIVVIILGNSGEKIKSGALSIVAIAAAVKILGSAIAQIGSLNPDQIIGGLAGISVALLELSAAAIAIGDSDFGIRAGAGVLLMAAAIKVIASAIQQMGSMDIGSLGNSLLAMGAALAEIGIFMTVMGDAKRLIGTATAMGILSLAIRGIADAMKTIGGLDPVQLASALAGIGVVLVELGVSLLVLGESAVKAIGAAAAIGLLCISLNALIPIILVFSQMNFDQLGVTLLGFAGALTVIGVAAALFAAAVGPMLIGAGVIAALGAACLVSAAGIAASAVAVGLLVSSFEALTTLSWLDLLSGIGKLVVVFAALSASCLLIAPTLPVVLSFSAALIGIGVAATILAASLSVAAIGTALMADALKKFDEVSWESIGKGMLVLVGALAALGITAIALSPVAPFILMIGAGIAAMGVGALSTAAALMLFIQAADLLGPSISNIMSAIGTFTVNAWNAITQFFDNLKQMAANLLLDISAFFTKAGAFIVDGFIIMGENIVRILVKLGAEMLKALGVPEDWVNVAVDFMNGLITGISSMLHDVVNHVKELGLSMIEGIRDAIDSHSDSKETIAVGEDFDGGLITGVLNLKDKVVGAVANVGNGMITQAKSDANSVLDIWDSVSKVYGKSLEFDVGLRNGTIVPDIAGVGYFNTQTGEIKNLIQGTRAAINAIQQETTSYGGNTGSTKSNTKAKKENKAANEAKTKAIQEESEALDEETGEVEDNEAAIRAQAEEIEVVTDEFDKYMNTLGLMQGVHGIDGLTKSLSKFWSKGFGKNGLSSVKNINAAFKGVTKGLNTLPKTVNGVAIAFDSTGKKYEKLSKKVSKSTKKIEDYVNTTGKMVVKVYNDYGKVFMKSGKAIDKFDTRLTKNIKNMGEYALGYKQLVKDFSHMYNMTGRVYDAEDAEWFISKLRRIEKYITTKGSASERINRLLDETFRKLTEGAEELEGALHTLGQSIDGISSITSKESQSVAYVEDAFISLAATLYDGSEAANEYATEHERLIFLMENGLATEEEVAAHYSSYIHRINQALLEYQQTIEKTIRSSMNLFEVFDKHLLDDDTDLLSNIESQIAGMKQWSDMLMELSKRGVDMNLLKVLTDEGTQSYGKLNKMLEMTSGEIALLNQRYKESEFVIQKSRDTALAALANATTRASQRAAAASKDMSIEQLKASEKVSKQLIDNAKAVAENQARYRSFTAEEEKKYLDSVSSREREAYQARLKEAQKAERAEQKLAAKEEARRKKQAKLEEKYNKIDKYITSYKKLTKAYAKYINDAKGITHINKQIADSLEAVNKKIKKTNGISVKNMRWNFIKLADTLASTGQEGLSYFEELKARIETYTDTMTKAVKITDKLFEEFKSAEKFSFDKMYGNATSNIVSLNTMRSLTNQLSKRNVPSQIFTYLYDYYMKNNDISGAISFADMVASSTDEQIKALAAKLKDATKSESKLLNTFMNAQAASTGANVKKEYEDAKKKIDDTYDKLVEAKKKFDKEKNAIYAAMDQDNDRLEDLEKRRAKALRKNNKNEADNITREIEALHNHYNQLSISLKNAQTAYEKVQASYDKANKNLKKVETKATNSHSADAAKVILDDYTAKAKTAKDVVEKNLKTVNDYSAEINKYDDTITKIYSKIESAKKIKNKKKRQAELDNLENELKTVENARSKAEKSLKKANKSLASSEKELAKVEKETAKWTETYNEKLKELEAARKREDSIQNFIKRINAWNLYSNALKEAAKDTELLARTRKKAADSLSGIGSVIDVWGQGWRNISDLSNKPGDTLDEITTAFLKMAETLNDVNSETDDWFANMGERLESYRNSIESTLTGQRALFDEFKKYSGESATDSNTYLHNMETQIDALSEWLTNIETLSKRGVSGGLLSMFATEGLSSFEKVAAFVNASDKDLADLNRRYSQYESLLAQATDRAMAAVGNAYTRTAESVQGSIARLASDARHVIEEQAEETAESSMTLVVTGVRNGVTNALPDLITTAEEAANKVAMTFGEAIDATKVTKAVTTGLSSIDTAIATTLALTLNDFYDLITAQAINKFKMAVDSINQYTNSVLQNEFTITIHVDTSEFDDAIARMNMAIYGINATAGVTSQAYDASIANQQAVTAPAQTDNASNVTNVNYTQNNYSPTALSRAEIYRQTRNQLSTIEGVVSASGG